MSVDWQTVIVFLALLAAVVYAVRRFWLVWKVGNCADGCSGCSSSQASSCHSPEQRIVQLGKTPRKTPNGGPSKSAS